MSDETQTNNESLSEDHIEMIYNMMSRRDKIFSKLIDPRRDLDHECGFPKTISNDQIEKLYKRNPIAKKVNNIWPLHSWKTTPEVTSIKDEGKETDQDDFDKAFDDLHSQLTVDDIPEDDGEKVGWFKSEKSSPLWEKLKQADIDSGICIEGYSVLLIGFDDGASLSEPLEAGKAKRVLYADSYPANKARVASTEPDSKSRRFGLPDFYNIDIDVIKGSETVTSTTKVHHTRVVQFYNSSSTDPRSRMETSYNMIHGSEKLIGAAPEGYFRMAFTKMLLESNPGTTREDFDEEKLNKQIDKFKNSLDGVASLYGMTGKSIAPQVVDPGPFFEAVIEMVCIAEDVPKRIFVGSERGELASTQDKQEWNERVGERQIRHVTPCIIAKFINRLIWAGVLPEPKNGFEIEWPALNELDEAVSAEVSLKRVQAMGAYWTSGLADLGMTWFDFLTTELGYSDEIATKIIDNFEKEFAERPDPEPVEGELDEDGNPVAPDDTKPGEFPNP